MKAPTQVKLGEISAYVNRGFSPSYVETDGVSILNQKCVRNGRIDFTLARLSSHKKTIPADKYLLPGDILINSTGVGTAGRVAFFDSSFKVSVDSHVTIVRINKKIADPKYVFYCLFGMEADIETFAEGSTGQIELSRDRVKDIDFQLPKLDEQRAIAAVLSSLDDKIYLLHRQNKTLLSIGQAVLKKNTTAGAPNVGWCTKKLGDLADVSWGDTNTTKKSYTSDGYDTFSASGLDGRMDHYDYDQPGIILSAIGANCGDTWLAFGKWSCIKNTIRILSKSEQVGIEYLYLYTHGKEFWPKRGSAQPFISQTDARACSVVVPDENTLNEFSNIAKPLFQKIDKNTKRIKLLAQVRDSLLPKLVSGEVGVI